MTTKCSSPIRIVLIDHGLCTRKRKTIDYRIDQTRTRFQELTQKLNRYNLKTEHDIDKACANILKSNNTESFFTYRIINDPVTTYKNKHRGRLPKNTMPEKIAVVCDHFRVQLDFDQSAYLQILSHYGYYPLLTNKHPQDLSIEDALLAHKKQYKSEHLLKEFEDIVSGCLPLADGQI